MRSIWFCTLRHLLSLSLLAGAMFHTGCASTGQSPFSDAVTTADRLQVRATSLGSGANQCWIFEPADAGAADEKLPLILFLHGWLEVHPRAYGAWIDHLVQQRCIVIYPAYQQAFTPFDHYTSNVLAAMRDSLAVLDSPDHATPDLDRLVVAGHSCGGILGANYAALAREHQLPEPRALFAAQPGIGGFFPMIDLQQLPAELILVSVATDIDMTVADHDARRLVARTPQIPASRKLLVRIPTDMGRQPWLISTHRAPLAFHPAYDKPLPLDHGQSRTLPNHVRQWRLPWEAARNELDDAGFWLLLDRVCQLALSDPDASAPPTQATLTLAQRLGLTPQPLRMITHRVRPPQ